MMAVKQNKVKSNILANYASRAWTSLMSLVFLPIYIRLLGVEAYGLVGFFITLQSLLAFFDLGLGYALNREMAKYSIAPGQEEEMRDMVRTLEIIYWGIAFLLGLAIIGCSGLIARDWVKAETLSPATIRLAVVIMGLCIACQWPLSLYAGGLAGLQRQVSLSVLNTGMTTFRQAGAVVILWCFSPTVLAYLGWQLISSVGHTLLTLSVLWRNLPLRGHYPRFRKKLLLSVWRFAAETSGILLMLVLVGQAENILLSKMLSLTIFGYYIFAFTVANTLSFLVTPVVNAVYPKLVQFIKAQEVGGLSQFYHLCCQLVGAGIFPMAIIIMLFSHDLLTIWTRNPVLGANSSFILSILIIASACNMVINLPNALTSAYGWTSLVLYVYIVTFVIYIPVLYLAILYKGVLGAATASVIMRFSHLLIVPALMHLRILKKEFWLWLRSDICLPAVGSFVVPALAWWFSPAGMPNLIKLGYIGLAFTLSLGSCVYCSNKLKKYLTVSGLNLIRYRSW
jgi:O-antigen/teichoic acid export membrane protein